MCGTFGACEGEVKRLQGFGGETRRKENTRRRMEDNIKIDVNAGVQKFSNSVGFALKL